MVWYPSLSVFGTALLCNITGSLGCLSSVGYKGIVVCLFSGLLCSVEHIFPISLWYLGQKIQMSGAFSVTGARPVSLV